MIELQQTETVNYMGKNVLIDYKNLIAHKYYINGTKTSLIKITRDDEDYFYVQELFRKRILRGET